MLPGGEGGALAETKPQQTAQAAGGKTAGGAGSTAPMPRRSFVNWLATGWVAFSAASAAGLTAMGRFMFPNVLFEPPSSFKAGLPEEFGVGLVDIRFKEKFGVWIVREEGGMYALLATCTHLGCSPNWLANEEKFKCPCHGSGFYASGINFEGPAPRPLERVMISLAEDGQILIDKARKFQQEKGQWEDTESYLVI